jgi:cell volume regulation protein A
MDVITAIAVIGVIILLGFIGALIFERTKVPDVLLLLLIGLVLGPVFTHYLGVEIFSAGMLGFIAPYLGALALIIILFDGGLDLNYDKVMHHLGVSVLHTVVIFVVNLILITVLFHFLVGFPLAIAILLGAVISGTSSAIVIPLLAGTSASEDTRTVLVLESVLTDVMCIVSVLTVISVLKGGAMDVGSISSNLLQPFAVAGMVGGLFAVLWLYVLKWIEGKKYAFMITIAALFILYSFTEYVKASGAIAVLVFGLVLSNRDEFQRIFRLRTRFVLDKKIMEFHDELTFVVRTFFFVYTGMVFSFVIPEPTSIPAFVPAFIATNPTFFFVVIMVILMLILIFARLPGSIITTRIKASTKKDLGIMAVMLPGGLTAAVLAQVAFIIPEYMDAGTAYHAALEPYKAMFVNTVFVVIVASVVITTICVFLIEQRRISKRASGSDMPFAEAKEPWTSKSPMYKKQLKDQPKAEWSQPKQIKTWQEPAQSKPPTRSAQTQSQPARAKQPQPQPTRTEQRIERTPAKGAIKSVREQAPPPSSKIKPKQPSAPQAPAQAQPMSTRKPPQARTGVHPLARRAAEFDKAQELEDSSKIKSRKKD